MTKVHEMTANNSDPVVDIEVITPAMAAKYLLRQHGNQRQLERRHVNKIAQDMDKAGGYALNGETIKFDHDGYLMDGQHRLSACVQCNQSFRTVVVHGVDRQSFYTIDSGRKRTFAQTLRMLGYKQTNNLSAVIHMLHRYFEGNNDKNLRSASHGELIHFTEQHPDLYYSLVQVTKLQRGPTTRTNMALVHYMINSTNPELAAQFSKAVLYGPDFVFDNVPPEYRALQVYRVTNFRLMDQGVRLTNPEAISGLITAFNHVYKKNNNLPKKWGKSGFPPFANLKDGKTPGLKV